MSSYRVTDVRPQLRLAALRDSLGRRHVVHLPAEIPEIGAQLEGPVLKVQQTALLVSGTGQVFSIMVEALECAELYVLERLHPEPHASVQPQVRPSAAPRRASPAVPALLRPRALGT